MKYVVFEAGSRAGFSTEMFFLDYVKANCNQEDVLYMVDDSVDVNQVQADAQIKRISYSEFLDLDKDDLMIFPADELTRQSKSYVNRLAENNSLSKVDYLYYYKMSVNQMLSKLTEGCVIKVPKTFDVSNVCVRPNTMSAGSKGIQLLDNVCITERISITNEYVVDVIRGDNDIKVYPREVVLKNGYDRMIKPLEESSDIGTAVKEFIMSAFPVNEGLFSGIFHLQIAKDLNGMLYYIESSKRLSGTSIVNIFRGMNPFCFINEVKTKERINPFQYNKWYRYEDFIRALSI